MDQLQLTGMKRTQIWLFAPFENVDGKIKFVRSFWEEMQINFAICFHIFSTDVTAIDLYKFAEVRLYNILNIFVNQNKNDSPSK
jgi:hypothetical protein